MRSFLTAFLAIFWLFYSSSVLAAKQPYSLGVVLVIDQFRADYLMRFKEKFLPVSANGFQNLMQNGAYFPLADHGLLQNMTGPGHAAILSGSYPYRNHIAINYWFDRVLNKNQYCVQDDAAKVISSDGVVATARVGVSPKYFNATTVGDELKNVDRPSRVVSIALKDRAAILLGGKRADEVYWFDDTNCQWVTSNFYTKSIPEYVKLQNNRLHELKKQTMSWGPYSNVHYCTQESTRTPWAVEETFKMALSSVDQLKLGKGKDTDLLLISLSSHDYLGHNMGPNDVSLEKMTIEEDRLIGQFFTQLSKKLPNGLKDVFVVMTGDHGVPPMPKHLPTDRIPAENVPDTVAPKIIEDALTKEFGAPKGGKWIRMMIEYHVYFDRDALSDAKVSIAKAIEVSRKSLLKERFLDQVWSLEDILNDRKLPAGEYGVIADHSLSSVSGDMILVLKPFFYSDSYPVTHMTMYSYDRYVPLIFWGKSFKPGTYRQIIRTIDIAPTLSSVLGVIPPSQSEGRVMNEILR